MNSNHLYSAFHNVIVENIPKVERAITEKYPHNDTLSDPEIILYGVPQGISSGPFCLLCT